jgi:hypothetical protein
MPLSFLSLVSRLEPETKFLPSLFAALDRLKKAFEKAGCADRPRETARVAG